MGAQFVVLLAVVLQQPQDTIRTYANPATRALVVRAVEQHRARDSAVSDYRARIRYRLSVSVGRRRWARSAVAAVEEQEALIAWQLPNELRVDVIGRRARSRSEALRLSTVFDRPWFVPRGVGDSVRIFSNDFPATGALHPLGSGAQAAYHYDLVDSLAAGTPDGGQIRLYAVQVIPKNTGPALVAGRLWLDARTAEVVRFTFRYVGTALWVAPDSPDGEDSSSARRTNSLVNRLLSIDADLEYALQDGKYWMPYRQSIAGTVRIPIVSDVVIPFQAVTTFDDYEINTGRPVAFELPLPDSTLGDPVRFEVHRPPNDSLAAYTGWRDSLRFDNSSEDNLRIRQAQADLARIVEELPGDLTGRTALGFGYQDVGDALQYNRVQGLSFGAGGRARVPGAEFADLFATVRYGLSDSRVTGRLALVRDAPGGRLAVSAYRDIADVDPFSQGRTLANSVNALFTGHDHGDYHVATGGSVGFVTSLAIALDLNVEIRGERHRSADREAESAVNDLLGGDGIFPSNPPVAEGDFGIASLRLTRFGALRWAVSAEAMAGQGSGWARLFADVRYGRGTARGYTLRLKAGAGADGAPPQMQFRLGGLNSVRGFEYGSLTEPAFWAAQLDVSPTKGTIRPILFIDAGQAAPIGDLFGSTALVGGGIGVSMYSPLLRTTLIRFDLSHPISPDTGGEWRFDIVFSPVR